MSTSPSRLEQVQRWMQSVLMHPGGVAEGVDSPEVRQHLDVSLADLESVIRRSQALSSANRLEIYVNAYYARLLECLAEEFAVTGHAVGEDLFGALAFGYVQNHPSQSYTLGQLGANFPRFLAESRLHGGETPAAAAHSWPDFVIELAQFERTLYEVYDGPGPERLPPFPSDRLAQLEPAAWASLRLRLDPSLRLCHFQHPVNAYWTAVKDDQQPPAPAPHPTWLAIHRRDYMVHRDELSADEFALLGELSHGRALGTAIAAVAATSADSADALNLQGWFARWVQAGYFAGFES